MKEIFMKLTKLILPSIIATALSSCWPSHNIHTVKNFDKLEQEISALDENSLVVFDVDDTLIAKKDKIIRHVTVPYKQLWLVVKYGPQVANKEKRLYVFSRILKDAPRELTDKQLPCIIKQLKKRGTKIIALTNGESGRLGVIENFSDFRLQEFEELGLNFSDSFPTTKSLEIQVKAPTHDGMLPLFKRGIICGNRVDKGQVLASFLCQLQWKPKRVIFIDDDKKFVTQVAVAMKQEEIDFLGLHYIKQKLEAETTTIDLTVADFQFNHLLKHDEWLSDEQVKKLNKKSSFIEKTK